VEKQQLWQGETANATKVRGGRAGGWAVKRQKQRNGKGGDATTKARGTSNGTTKTVQQSETAKVRSATTKTIGCRQRGQRNGDSEGITNSKRR
jgi:hypothetical protein